MEARRARFLTFAALATYYILRWRWNAAAHPVDPPAFREPAPDSLY